MIIIAFAFLHLLILTASAYELNYLKSDEGRLKVKVPINRTTIIDAFPNHGATLQTLLTYHGKSFYDHPCLPLSSSIYFENKEAFSLVPQYSNDEFEQYFINGTFTQKWPQLMAMVHIDQGVLVFSNTGTFTLIQVSPGGAKKIQEIFFNQIYQGKYFSSTSKVVLIYYVEEEIVYMIGSTLSVYFQVSVTRSNLLEIHFSSAFECTLPTTNEFQNYAVSGKYLFFAKGSKGLAIYEIRKGVPILLDSIKGNFVDVKVVSHDGDQRTIYALDSSEGVRLYSMIFGKVSSENSIIRVHKGTSFDIYRNSLVIVREGSNKNYLADDFQISDGLTWILLNTWAFESKIYKVHLTKKFAVFLGLNGHYTIQHSIYKDFYSRKGTQQTGHMSKQIAIHGLIEMDFFASDLKTQESQEFLQHESKTLFGITTHQLIFVEWKEMPLRIECFSDNDEHIIASPLKLEFAYNTSQCKRKLNEENDLEMCIQNKNYEIYFVKSFITMKHKIKIFLVILLLASLFIAMIIIIMVRYLQFRKERLKVDHVIVQLSQNGQYPASLEESKDKINKNSGYMKGGIGSYDRTPYNEEVGAAG